MSRPATHRWVVPVGLALLALALRLLCWSRMPAAAYPRGAAFDQYTKALGPHLTEYLMNDHTEPPGLSIIHAVLLRLVGLHAFAHWVVMPGLLLGSLATALLYDLTCRLGAGPVFGAIVAALYSAAIVPLEVWVAGCNFDHYTVGLTIGFAWALMRWVSGSPKASWFVSLFGTSLVLIQKVGYLIVPIMILLTGWLCREQSERVRRTVLALMGPLVASIALVLKNLLLVGIAAPTSLIGPNLMLSMNASYDYDHAAVHQFAAQAHAPDWYLWCYDRAEQLQPGMGFYGMCYTPDGGSHTTFAFDALQAFLRDHGPARLAAVVAQDRWRLTERPYLVSFMVPEMSPRFAVEYSRVSIRVFWAFVRIEPLRWLKQLAHSHFIFLFDGWRFLPLVLNNRASQGIQPLAWLPFGPLFLAATAIAGLCFAQGYFGMYWVLFARPRRAWQCLRTPARAFLRDRLALVAVFGTLLGSGAFLFACCENGRYFIQITPYLMGLLAWSSGELLTEPQQGEAEPATVGLASVLTEGTTA